MQWGTVYISDLLEFTKEEIMKMYPKDVVNIRVPRRYNWRRKLPNTNKKKRN